MLKVITYCLDVLVRGHPWNEETPWEWDGFYRVFYRIVRCRRCGITRGVEVRGKP